LSDLDRKFSGILASDSRFVEKLEPRIAPRHDAERHGGAEKGGGEKG
jgi:hypothetical protein